MDYHVVEMRPERENYPVVIASPVGKAKKEPLKDEEEDLEVSFDRLYYGGKAEYKRPKRLPIYHGSTSWYIKQRVVQKRRNQPHRQLLRQAGLAP